MLLCCHVSPPLPSHQPALLPDAAVCLLMPSHAIFMPLPYSQPAGGSASDEVLVARRRNQLLSCDLTGDDGAPQWEAVERPVHSLE